MKTAGLGMVLERSAFDAEEIRGTMNQVIIFLRHTSGACALDKGLLATAVTLAIIALAQAMGFALTALYSLFFAVA